jgi:hypothetical protein
MSGSPTQLSTGGSAKVTRVNHYAIGAFPATTRELSIALVTTF